jgi:hypothetical protein
VASRGFVDEFGAQLGDRIPLVSWTREQLDRGGFFNEPPQGYAFDAELVGIIDAPEELENRYTAGFVSPGLFDAEPVVSGQTIMSVRLEPGATIEQLRADLDGLPDGASFTVEPGRIVADSVRGAVDAQSRGIWLMAVVAAIGAVVALGQILSRHVRLADVERRPLQAVGSTSGQLVGESLSRAAVPAILGTALGAVLAVAASGFFPTGFVRRIEPDLGVQVDTGVLVLGSLALVVAVLVWVGVTLLLRPRHAPAGPSIASEALARNAPSPAAATGVRFALTGHERSAATAAGTLVTLGLLVGGVVAAATFTVSLDQLVTDPGRFGSNYTFSVEGSGELSPDDMRRHLESDPDVAGLMILAGAEARSGATTVDLIGVQHVKGDLAPERLVGRLPSGPDEVALGRVTADELDLGVGDELALTGSGGEVVYRVVGLAVVPGLAGYEGLGQATVLTAAPLLMGVPLGLIGGAVVFRAFADSIGALPEPTLPILALVAIALGLIAVANVAAVLPARRARRLSTAELLRAD